MSDQPQSQSNSSKPASPILTAAQIKEALTHRQHPINPAAARTSACLSDLAGLNVPWGIHLATIAPADDSTEIHTHLAEAEWMYVLDGEALLVLVWVGEKVVREGNGEGKGEGKGEGEGKGHVVREEHVVRKGDFIAFPAGPPETTWAHKMVGGEVPCTYLLGGDRKEVDVITYPIAGKTLVIHEPSNTEKWLGWVEG